MLIATWQITLAISFNCVIAFPDLFEEALSYLAIASLDIVPELGLDCYYASFDYASKMVAVSLAPIGVAVLLCMMFFLSTWCSSGDNPEERYRLRVATYSCKFNQVKFESRPWLFLLSLCCGGLDSALHVHCFVCA